MVTNATLWRQVYDDLSSQIGTGQLKDGDRLPSEPALMAAHGVGSRATIRRAVRELASEGLVGEDRRVIEFKRIPLRASAEETITLIEDVTAAGHTLSPARITVKLEGPVLVREVYREVDGKPYTWAEWRFPLAVAERTRLAYNEDIEQGSIRYLKEGLGWTVTQETPYYDPRPPTAQERIVLPVTGWVLAEHRAGTMTHPEMGLQRFSAVRILDAARTRLVP